MADLVELPGLGCQFVEFRDRGVRFQLELANNTKVSKLASTKTNIIACLTVDQLNHQKYMHLTFILHHHTHLHLYLMQHKLMAQI